MLRYTSFQDVGRAIHPAYVEGQMQVRIARDKLETTQGEGAFTSGHGCNGRSPLNDALMTHVDASLEFVLADLASQTQRRRHAAQAGDDAGRHDLAGPGVLL
jgi:hypothetical protein